MKPRSVEQDRGGGWDAFSRALLRREPLVIAQADDVLEHRRTWRQVRRIQEQVVEEVVSDRRAVHYVAALEGAGSVLRIVHTDQRTCIVDGRPVCASVLEVAQEIMHAAVGAEVLATPGGLRKRYALAGGDGEPVVAIVSFPGGGGASHISWEIEATRIRPALIRHWKGCGGGRIGKQRDCAPNYPGPRVLGVIVPSGPEGIRGAAVIVSQNVDPFLRGNCEADRVGLNRLWPTHGAHR